MTVEMPEGYFNIEVRDSENCWVVRMMPDGSIDINPKFTASEAGAKFVRVVREISGRMTTEVNEELVQRVALVMANKMKAAADSVNSTAWISGPNAGYGGPHEEMVTQVAMTLDGEFDLCVLARAALSTLAPSAAPTTDWQWIQPRLKEALETRSSREIAAEIGLGHATVCRIANGHGPSVSSYFAIVKWLSPRTTPADDNPFFTQGARNDIPIPTLKEMIDSHPAPSPSAEAAQPVAVRLRNFLDAEVEGQETIISKRFLREILAALSQPQGELREALRQARVLLQKARIGISDEAFIHLDDADIQLDKIDAALAGRTAG
jgi:hypothetical protein